MFAESITGLGRTLEVAIINESTMGMNANQGVHLQVNPDQQDFWNAGMGQKARAEKTRLTR